MKSKNDGNEYMNRLHKLRAAEMRRIKVSGKTILDYLRELRALAADFPRSSATSSSRGR